MCFSEKIWILMFFSEKIDSDFFQRKFIFKKNQVFYSDFVKCLKFLRHFTNLFKFDFRHKNVWMRSKNVWNDVQTFKKLVQTFLKNFHTFYSFCFLLIFSENFRKSEKSLKFKTMSEKFWKCLKMSEKYLKIQKKIHSEICSFSLKFIYI